jgi:hypothetical protein
MQRMFNVSMIVSLMILLLGAQQSLAQDKDDIKAAKTIEKVAKWECKKLQKDGREVNIKAVAGIVTMSFTVRKEKKNKTIVDKNGKEKTKKVKEITNVFKMEMGGNDRIFNYNVKSDSIQFVGLKGFNDYRVVRIEKDEMILEHDLDDSLFRWTMIPAPKEKKTKQKPIQR